MNQMKTIILNILLLAHIITGNNSETRIGLDLDTSETRIERDANQGSIHLSPLPVHLPLPTQPSGYSYNPSPYPDIPGPAYHTPLPHHAEPIYGHHPSHNCTVEDEVLSAEICTPTYTSSCGPFKVKGTKLGEKEKCVTVSKTVCTQAQDTQPVEVCLIEYQDKKHTVTATTVEVKFSKECEKQKVTVCQPQPAYGEPTPYSYHTVQHCKEVGQETCYNVPRLESKQIEVEITLPEPVEKCQTRSVIVPTVECEDVNVKKCIKLPSVEEADVEAQACVPVVDKPKCDKVELVLPKQVCRELLYGYAEKPVIQHEQSNHLAVKHKYEQSNYPAVIHLPKLNNPPALTHKSKIKYGPKLVKKISVKSKSSKTPKLVVSKIPDIYTV